MIRMYYPFCMHKYVEIHRRVLMTLLPSLLSQDYHVLGYNSRGVGGSTGWPSFTGFSEAEDLKALVIWAMETISDVHSVVLVVRWHNHPFTTSFSNTHDVRDTPMAH